jgi:hypothetical protein
MPLMIVVATYLLCLLLAALGMNTFVPRFVTAVLIACVLAAIVELAIGWWSENNKGQ